jgi:NAD(P)-dependent dehydrogenase (short-subunit alcohol dehydrogenase family)
MLASHGAKVVVNDLDVNPDGTPADVDPASEVVAEIRARGGDAVVSRHNVADWADAEAMVRMAVDKFGDLHVLVNNAGILRDRTLANMSEAEWDEVITVHLKGHAAPSRHALAYWRERSKAGLSVKASIVHTSSVSGYRGTLGQANYSAAKLAVVALSRVIQLEAAQYGVRSNAISPSARTRMIGSIQTPPPAQGFDARDPSNVSAVVAWLAAPDCPANGQFFQVYGSRLLVLTMPQVAADLMNPAGQWSMADLDRELPQRLVTHQSGKDLIADLNGRQAA